MNFGRIIFWVALLAVGAAFVGWTFQQRIITEEQISAQAALAHDEAISTQEKLILFTEKIVPPRLPFNVLLEAMGIHSSMAARITAAAQPVFNLRQLRAGNQLSVGRSVFGDLRAVRYRIDKDRVL